MIDSGATSHITNDVVNISSPTPYTGIDKVYIGDGKGLSIHHIGSSALHTPHNSFKLQNVLHVPYMKHNLLSAYQFLKDNNCSLTLDPYGSTVKDRISGKMLLRGPVKDGFYPLHGSSNSSLSPPSALLSVKAPVKVWHRRLGHPSLSLFRRVILLINWHYKANPLLISSAQIVHLPRIISSLLESLLQQQVTVFNFCTVIYGVQHRLSPTVVSCTICSLLMTLANIAGSFL